MIWVQRLRRVAITVSGAAALALVALFALSALNPGTAAADQPSPHLSSGTATGNCAACHRSHTAQENNLLETTSVTALCFSCHDGTGADSNVAAEYADTNVPADNPSTATYYAHRLDVDSLHTSGLSNEFGGVLNRHSACTDCHNPHAANSSLAQQTPGGWTPSGALAGVAGVTAGLTLQTPLAYEYELCLKCHSRFTTLFTSSTPTQNMTDKAKEIETSAGSFHPIAGPGTNTTEAMQNSLAGGAVWQLSVGSTIRCTQCHGNYRLLGNPPADGVPAETARLAPHTSRFQGLLAANYRSRDLKPQNEAYNSADFTLCFLCHSEAPFNTTSEEPRTDTNYPYHGKHLGDIAGEGSGGTDINIAGAGQGNAICAECHFELHSTNLAQWTGNRIYSRGVNFGPNVQPRPSYAYPIWDAGSRTCALVCHGEDHDNESY